MTTCKKCILTTDYPGLVLDSQGVCQLCRADNHSRRCTPDPERVKKSLDNFEETIRTIKGKYPYDAVICLSGGKDSVYLASILKEKYGLNLLAFNVQTGFDSSMAGANLSGVVRRLDLPLKTFSWPSDFSRRFYRHFFTHPLREGLTATICRVCHLALLSSAVRLARKENIPLVMIGYSPFQITQDWFYELTKENFMKPYGAGNNFREATDFNPEIKAKFYFPEEGEDAFFPRILMPLHILDYPSEKDVRDILHRSGLLERQSSLPRRGMCDLLMLMNYCDTLHFGDPPFRDWVSEKIRKGEAERWKYLMGFKIFKWLCRTRLFKRKLIRITLHKLDLTEKEVLDSLKNAQESEEFFDDIYKINPSRDLIADLKGKN